MFKEVIVTSMLILEVILGLIIAVFFYNLIHHFLVVLPDRREQRQTKRQSDLVVPKIINALLNEKLISRSPKIINSHSLSSVWGRSIFAYEYVLALNLNQQQLIRFRDRFEQVLLTYCRNHHLTTKHGLQLYLVSEVWVHNHHVHLTIAAVKNSATIDYLKDVHRL